MRGRRAFDWGLNTPVLIALSALMGVIAVGTAMYHSIEGWSWTSSFYFTVCTVTTLGYGDLVPTTESSRLLTALFALAGVSIGLASFSLIGANYLRRTEYVLSRMRSVD